MLELEKLRTRVDEFNDYGELDMMQQYVQDVRAVQKRLNDVSDQIGWINKVTKHSVNQEYFINYIKFVFCFLQRVHNFRPLK